MLHVIVRWNVFSKKYCKTTNELTSISTKRRNVTRNLKLVIWKCGVQFNLRNDSRIEISYDMISAMIIQFKFLPRIILRFVKLMFSHTVDVPRQVLELHLHRVLLNNRRYCHGNKITLDILTNYLQKQNSLVYSDVIFYT